VVTFKWVAEVIVGIRRIKERNLLKLWQNNKNKIVLLFISKFGSKYIKNYSLKFLLSKLEISYRFLGLQNIFY